MKKLFLLGLLILPASNFAQTSNALSFKVFTATVPTITSLGGLSPGGSIYTGGKLQILGTGFSSGCNVNIDGAVQPGSSVSFVSATEIDYTVQPSLGSATGTSHAVSVTCTQAPLAQSVPPCVDAPGCPCTTVKNPDGSFSSYSCLMGMLDGTTFTYQTWVLSSVYPNGLSVDAVTGVLYALAPTADPSVFIRTPSGCTTNFLTGAVTCAALKLKPPKRFSAVVAVNSSFGKESVR